MTYAQQNQPGKQNKGKMFALRARVPHCSISFSTALTFVPNVELTGVFIGFWVMGTRVSEYILDNISAHRLVNITLSTWYKLLCSSKGSCRLLYP